MQFWQDLTNTLYKKHLHQYPISAHLSSKEDLVKWCFNLHNMVNRSLGKEDFINELNTMVSLGEIDKKGFRYSMGETYAEINKRVSKLEQKYNGLIEAVIE